VGCYSAGGFTPEEHFETYEKPASHAIASILFPVLWWVSTSISILKICLAGDFPMIPAAGKAANRSCSWRSALTRGHHPLSADFSWKTWDNMISQGEA